MKTRELQARVRRDGKCFLATVLGGALLALSLSGCSGGGSNSTVGGDTTIPTTPTVTNTSLTGVAMAGPVDGQVCVYPLSAAGVVGAQLVCGPTAAGSGAYSLAIPDYVGNVLLSVTGRYVDEATGSTIDIPANQPLRSVTGWTTAGGTHTAAITPFTEAAIRAAGTLTENNILAAMNNLANALGLNPRNPDNARSQLTETLPNLSSTGTPKLYAHLLNYASQAQMDLCGTTPTCLTDYLSHLQALLSGLNPVSSIQSEYQMALTNWTVTHPNGTTTCHYSDSQIDCTTTPDGNGQMYSVDVTASVNGVAAPTTHITAEGSAVPTNQAEFCSAEYVNQMTRTFAEASGTLSVASCSYSGDSNGGNGHISLTATFPAPIPSMTIIVDFVYAKI